MAKNESHYLEKYLEAKFGEVNSRLDDMVSGLEKAEMRASSAESKAQEAHSRIDAYENKFYGWLFGAGISGGGVGAMIMKLLH